MPPRIPEIEWRCEEDDAWYTVTIELINDNSTLRIHYPEFDIDYDEKYDLTYFRTKKELKSRFRLASIQLQDHFCKQVVAKSCICACCSNDGEDNKFYDAIVKKVDVSDHRFPDGEEVCTCLFHIIWQAGPNDGKEMVLQCGNICLLNETDIETHPVLKMVLSLIGDGSSRSKAKTSGTNRRRQSTKNVGRKRLQDINEFSLPVSRVISCQCTNTTNEKTHNTGSDTAGSTCLSVLKPEKKCSQEKIQSTADSVNFSGESVQERIDSCTDSYNNVLRWSDEKDDRAIPQKDENNSLAVYPLEDHETELTTSSYITSSEKETVSRHCSNNTCRITDGNILSLDRGKRKKLEASREGHIFRSNYLDDSYKLQDKIHAHKHFQPDNLCETMESERKCAVRKLSQQSSEDNILNCIYGVTGNKDFTSEIIRHDSKGATEDTDHVIDPDSVRTHGKYQAYNYKDDPYKGKDTNQIHTCLQVNRLDSKKDITPSVKNSKEDDLNCECTVKAANGDILENTNNNKHVANAECQYLYHQNSTKVIVIDNIEKDVGPFDVMDMLDAVVSGVQKVVMPPALSYEHCTKAFVFFKDDSSLVEAYDTLLGDFFIASSKGRPWVVLDPMELEYKNDFIAFTAECKGRRKSSRPLLSGTLGIVPQDSPEYPRAEKMKRHYLEFRRQYVLLNKQVKFFEGQVTQKK